LSIPFYNFEISTGYPQDTNRLLTELSTGIHPHIHRLLTGYPKVTDRVIHRLFRGLSTGITGMVLASNC
tara:strand:- start:674 stop:880 length:207 start_codon:yes stop_codon:yes gene_type:complete